jgi:hypothetical protein
VQQTEYRSSAGQEVPCCLWHPNVHYLVHEHPPIVPVLTQTNSVRTSPSHYVKQALGLDRKKILLIHEEMGLEKLNKISRAGSHVICLNYERTEVSRNIREELVSVAVKWGLKLRCLFMNHSDSPMDIHVI